VQAEAAKMDCGHAQREPTRETPAQAQLAQLKRFREGLVCALCHGVRTPMP